MVLSLLWLLLSEAAVTLIVAAVVAVSAAAAVRSNLLHLKCRSVAAGRCWCLLLYV